MYTHQTQPQKQVCQFVDLLTYGLHVGYVWGAKWIYYFPIIVIIGVHVVCDHVIKQPLQAEPNHYFIQNRSSKSQYRESYQEISLEW